MFCNCVMVGRLATEPELKYTPGGHAVCTFRVAVDRQRSGADGERATDFHDVVCWRQTAEFAANYLNKGRLVLVEGEYQIRPWVAQDGSKRKSYELVTQTLKALDSPKSGTGNGNGHGAVAPGIESADPGSVPAGVTGSVSEGETPDFSDPFEG